MKKFVAVIGATKFGKSTIIKSLTGCPTNNYRGLIRDHATERSILVICGSPQEQRPDQYLSVEELSAFAERS